MKLSNQYHELGKNFYHETFPLPVSEPELLLWNGPLARTLDLSFSVEEDNELLGQYFSGNQLIKGSKPIAQAYSGHQFGHFNPQLGDGRAHLLGDVTDEQGNTWDVQLKGSGTSHFSRSGDGRCALGPALREFVMSEAMSALGVPTTRCLAVVATGDAVYRERPYPGAVVTRIAASHIRVGTFQYFAVRKDIESLKKLTRFAIERHFPEIKITPRADERSTEALLSSQNALDFFAAVLDKQVALVVSWLRVGFIHGVMNTDNTAISGETIDYGPCAMMNHYHHDTVFSSIDRDARYAFGNQSQIIQWNMARLADCLLPLVDEGEDIALAKITPLLQQFANDLQYGYFEMMGNKLGIAELVEGDIELVNDLLAIMQKQQLDYTQYFVALAESLTQEEVDNFIEHAAEAEPSEQELWLTRWYSRISDDVVAAKALMEKTNPLVIPRNHHVERVLAISEETGDLSALHEFLAVLQQPYDNSANTKLYQDAPSDGDENYHTFCGT
ncbi:protein adenylyltransferase SelO [Cognaticolwellia mytili]|uniref:protein adenylyltransferase SelO n=1 Tax=Cognaticolwellia mytili TaxID=1888913 RepID=UPI00146D9CFC|nr:YdiU family protein [Cognaticolwellia mytili]